MSKITIIAEIGINHQGRMSVAKELISQAKRCGADLVKSQLYDVDKLVPNKKIIAQGRNWYEEIKKTKLSKEQAEELFQYGQQLGIEVFYSVFDLERLQWCEEIGVKRYKIATRWNQDKELIKAVITTNKPVFISLTQGGSNDWYNDRITPQYELSQISQLYCVPEYPTELTKLYFNLIDFTNKFQGFSDHTIGIEAAICAMARGAKVIEKHFTLDRNMTGPDMICSMEPNELRELVRYARKFEEIL